VGNNSLEQETQKLKIAKKINQNRRGGLGRQPGGNHAVAKLGSLGGKGGVQKAQEPRGSQGEPISKSTKKGNRRGIKRVITGRPISQDDQRKTPARMKKKQGKQKNRKKKMPRHHNRR